VHGTGRTSKATLRVPVAPAPMGRRGRATKSWSWEPRLQRVCGWATAGRARGRHGGHDVGHLPALLLQVAPSVESRRSRGQSGRREPSRAGRRTTRTLGRGRRSADRIVDIERTTAGTAILVTGHRKLRPVPSRRARHRRVLSHAGAGSRRKKRLLDGCSRVTKHDGPVGDSCVWVGICGRGEGSWVLT
jgi:hypothetical protein